MWWGDKEFFFFFFSFEIDFYLLRAPLIKPVTHPPIKNSSQNKRLVMPARGSLPVFVADPNGIRAGTPTSDRLAPRGLARQGHYIGPDVR